MTAVPSPAPGPKDEAADLDEDLRRRLDTAREGGDKRYHAKLKEQNKLFERNNTACFTYAREKLGLA